MFSKTKKKIIFLAFISVVFLLFLNYKFNIHNRIGFFVLSPVYFFSEWANGLGTFSNNLSNIVNDNANLNKEIEDLKKQNEELKLSYALMLKDMQNLYEERAFQNFKAQNPKFKLLRASVLYRTEPFYQDLIINVGSNEGVKIGMPVISDGCIVGLISDVAPNFSKVSYIGDKSVKIPVKLNGSNLYGILEGTGSEELIFNVPSVFAAIHPLEVLVTASVPLSLLPPNIPVAKVMTLREVGSLNTIFTAVPMKKIQTVNEVWVYLGS
ncbi:rod shape-determining protein MreC [Thermodesulfobium acidiphilum]|uniref:Cell shape-determining protein MreC n=1 Tax=Thermodesulfobium acidiphilum TaxID=1794699 RepID=A0A2R4VZN8_THEAF|nr:rod shape-determining protein MreC [Thermodesulfobium acidiphilum]AWB10021.1 rod shape-determining protein MreC [Thermodesulfobium acidiphilum]